MTMSAVTTVPNSMRIQRLLWFALFVCAIFWSIATYGEICLSWLGSRLLVPRINGEFYPVDFVSFYGSGFLARSFVASHHGNIYSTADQLTALNAVMSPASMRSSFYVPYPPYFFVLMMPFSCMPLQYSWLLWSGCGLLLTAVASYLFSREYFQGTFSRTLVVLLLLAANPTWWAFRIGNTAVWLIPSLVFSWLYLRRAQPFRAALASAVILFKLQYLPLLLVAGGALGGRRFFFGITALSTCLLLASVAVLGIDNVAAFHQALKVGDSPNVLGVNVHMFQNLRGSLFLWLGWEPESVTSFFRLIFLGGGAITAWLWLSRRCEQLRNSACGIEFVAAISVLIALVTGVHNYKQDYVLALLPCVWLWKWIDAKNDLLPVSTRLGLRGLLLAFPVLSWLFFCGGGLFLRVLKLQPYADWAIIVLALSIFAAFQTRRSTTRA